MKDKQHVVFWDQYQDRYKVTFSVEDGKISDPFLYLWREQWDPCGKTDRWWDPVGECTPEKLGRGMFLDVQKALGDTETLA